MRRPTTLPILLLAGVIANSHAGFESIQTTPSTQAIQSGQPTPSIRSTAPVLPQQAPISGGELRDREFGVVSRGFGLDRRVEMYQWSANGQRYRRVWNAALIDSSGFAPGHENPPALPIEGQRWWAQRPSLDGRPIAGNVLQAIGEWHVFRPDFSRLPLNMAATFQPEGDGLGSATNLLDPQVGDLRVTWRELRLPPLPGRVQLQDGIWQLSAQTAAAALNAAPLPPVLDGTSSDPGWIEGLPWWLAGIVLLLSAAATARWLLGRRR